MLLAKSGCIWSVTAIVGALLFAGTAYSGGFTVTNTDDEGAGSLRQALQDADVSAGSDTITFNIPGAGPHTIQVGSDLPAVAGGVIIDGLTQPGASCDSWPPTLMVEIFGGSSTEARRDGIEVAGNATVRGLVINGFVRGDGVRLIGPGSSAAECNYLGTDVTGTQAIKNSRGIVVSGFGGGNVGNRVGGTTATARNLISGNSTGIALISGASETTVQGNYVGTTADGTAALANDDGIVTNFSDDNLIGGTAPGAGNLISGNLIGLSLTSGSENNRVEGNYVGTDVSGLLALPNQNGIGVEGSDNIIGGTAPEAGNVISGNTFDGLFLFNAVSGVRVEGNLIGLDATGVSALGNGSDGVNASEVIDNSIGGTEPGAGNTIAYNGDSGVVVREAFSPSLANSILGNSIYANGELGIDLRGSSGSGSGVNFNDPGDADTGANGYQNYPLLDNVPVMTGSGTTSVSGSLNSSASTQFRIEFFASATCNATRFGEGEQFISTANVTTNGSGVAQFTEALATAGIPSGWFITATATDAVGNTSEFSQCDAIPGSAIVTHTGDTGEGSLREAINFANADPQTEVVMFNIEASTDSGCDESSGVCTIQPLSSLPSLKGASSIDGLSQPGASCASWPPTLKVVVNGALAGSTSGIRALDIGSTVSGLVINGFDSSGLFLGDQGSHSARCNFIGTDSTGTQAVGNDFAGVSLAGTNNSIGGATAFARNLISGNIRHGVYTRSSAASSIQGNYIGTDASGTQALGNGDNGISLLLNFNSDLWGGHAVGGSGGRGNVIAFNGAEGILISEDSSNPAGTHGENSVLGNSIYSNSGRGIVLCDAFNNDCDLPLANDIGDTDEGPNNLQNHPGLVSVAGNGANGVEVTYSVDSAIASSAYPIRVEFFVADADDEEGATFLGAISYPEADAMREVAGEFVAQAPLANGVLVVATATDAQGNSSEFSLPIQSTGSSNPLPDLIFESNFD